MVKSHLDFYLIPYIYFSGTTLFLHTNMTNNMAIAKDNSEIDLQTRLGERHEGAAVNWGQALTNLNYAYQKPVVTGEIKVVPTDFIVTEVMDVLPSGEGEHYWLDVSKVECNTEQLAKQLARFAGVHPRDVGFSGLKDFFAQTRQWFSVWKPKGGVPAWNEFKMGGVTIHQVVKHSRKIKRGTHRANHFEIKVQNLTGDIESLNDKLAQLRDQGVPNYFGAQRFGRNADNMNKAYEMLVGNKKVKSRNLRSLLLSSARSWMFNKVISARIEEQTWNKLKTNEPANLNTTNSVFTAQGDEQEQQRLAQLDIHPTAPMWGEGEDKAMTDCSDLVAWESRVLNPYAALKQGLENARLDYQRRAIRCVPTNLTWQLNEQELTLKFELQRGQFATSVLREVVTTS